MKSAKTIQLFLFLAIAYKIASGQNLVPNAGFESYSACPSAKGELWLAFPWDTLNSNPDLFNECNLNTNYCQSVSTPDNFAGSAASHSGNGYAGFMATDNFNNREYLQTGLVSSLISGKIYKTEAWFRRSSYSQFAAKTLGMMLSVGPLSQTGTTYLGFPPQAESTITISDTADWTLVQKFIIAAGGENNITIGNFRDDASTGITSLPNASVLCPLAEAYYYVDDVRVELINEQIFISGDSVICPGGTTTLFANANTPTWWSLASDPLTPLTTSQSLSINPAVNTTYILNGIFYQDSITVSVIQPPFVELGNDTTFCEENFIVLDATNANATYTWSTGESTPVITAGQSQLYWVEVDNNGCTASDSINITVLTNPAIDLGNDSVFCSVNSDFITLDAGEGTGYLWLPTFEITTTILVTKEGLSSVSVNHLNGCKNDTSINIKEICKPEIFVPSSFTPNSDGINDFLFVYGNSFESFELSIYNRFGELVFKTGEISVGWDGTFKCRKLPAGVYIYFMKYKATDASGNETSANSGGIITLIR